MTLCIKKDLFDHTKLYVGNATIINENKFFQLNYKYDTNVYGKFYFLTDWIQISSVDNNTYYKYTIIWFKNDELKNILNVINKKIIFNVNTPNTPNNTNNTNNTNNINNINNADIDYDQNIIEENNKTQTTQTTQTTQLLNQENKSGLIYLADNYNELSEEDKNEYCLRFNKLSEIILHPSKKSGLPEYTLNKVENFNEIKRYFPSINKPNDDFKIVGKFLIYINIYYISDTIYGITINIKSGHIKYEKTYISNDKLHIKPIYDNQIKIEI